MYNENQLARFLKPWEINYIENKLNWMLNFTYVPALHRRKAKDLIGDVTKEHKLTAYQLMHMNIIFGYTDLSNYYSKTN